MRRFAGLLLLAAIGCGGWDSVFLDTPEGRWGIVDPEGIDLAEKWVQIEWVSGSGPAKGRLTFVEMKSEPVAQALMNRDAVRRRSVHELTPLQSEESLGNLRKIFEKYGRPASSDDRRESDEGFEGKKR